MNSRILLTVAALVGLSASPATVLPPVTEGLRAPTRLATDAAGNLYVADPGAGQLIAFDAFGRRTVARQNLAGLVSLAVDASGGFLVGDQSHGCVSVFDSQWGFRYQFGVGNGEFGLPNFIAVDPASGSDRVYVCDARANQVKIYRQGLLVAAFGSAGTAVGQFDFPAGVFVSPAGEVFVVDQGNDRVQVFDRSGTFRRSFRLGSGSTLTGRSGRAQGITGDTQGRIYVADSFQGVIKIFDAQGNSQGTWGDFGQAAGQLRTPVDLAIDGLNRLCVASANNGRVERVGLDTYLSLSVVPATRFVASGTDVVFSVAAGGVGSFSYQWRNGTNDLSDGGTVSGANSSTLRLAGVTRADSGSYSVVAAGPAGTLVSPAAALTVLDPPRIVAHPTSQSVFEGAEAILEVSATGDALVYQWQREGLDLPGATAAALAVTNAQLADSGRYVAMVRNAVGALTSEPATLTVRRQPGAPRIETLAGAPGTGILALLNADPGYLYEIEGSTNLVDWRQLTHLTNETGIVEITLPGTFGEPMEFYRVKWSP